MNSPTNALFKNSTYYTRLYYRHNGITLIISWKLTRKFRNSEGEESLFRSRSETLMLIPIRFQPPRVFGKGWESPGTSKPCVSHAFLPRLLRNRLTESSWSRTNIVPCLGLTQWPERTITRGRFSARRCGVINQIRDGILKVWRYDGRIGYRGG